jgi:hypothetical protein
VGRSPEDGVDEDITKIDKESASDESMVGANLKSCSLADGAESGYGE